MFFISVWKHADSAPQVYNSLTVPGQGSWGEAVTKGALRDWKVSGVWAVGVTISWQELGAAGAQGKRGSVNHRQLVLREQWS